MTHKAQKLVPIAAALLLAGCATGNGEVPLMFASSDVIGISIGANMKDTNGEFVVGYKGNHVAVVPVSAVKNGKEEFIGSEVLNDEGELHRDSFSILGHFDVSAERRKKGINAGLGKFFATGIAAHNVAIGFSQKMGVDRTAVAECKEILSEDEQQEAAKDLKKTSLRSQSRSKKPPAKRVAPDPIVVSKGAPPAKGAVNPALLIFAQQQMKALAIDGSALESGLKLTLGARDRSFAVIPVIGRDAEGNFVSLHGENPGGGTDVLSVLGKFESKDEVSAEEEEKEKNEAVKKLVKAGATEEAAKAALTFHLKSTLGSFFSTGAAADYLSHGFKTRLCEEYKAVAQAGNDAAREEEAAPKQTTARR